MKKILLLAIIALFVTSCVTQKKCNQKFPPIYIEKTDTIHDSIFMKEVSHDTIYSIIVGKDTTKYDTVQVTIREGLVNSKPITIKGEFADATTQVINSKLNLKLEEKSKELNIVLKDAIKEKLLYKYYYEKSKTKQVIEKKVKVGKFYVWYFYISLIVLLGILGWKNRRLIIKLIKPI